MAPRRLVSTIVVMLNRFQAPIASHPALAPALAAGLRSTQVEQAAAFYDEPHRHYHGRAHIVEMLDFALNSGFALTAAQALAVLFHDAVYVPGAARGSNETMSAQMMRVYQGRVSDEVIEVAYGIVIDTADHIARRPESQLVLDLDLIRLGALPAQFARWSSEVFEEQRPLIAIDDEHAAREFFETRRAPFFERLLARDAIYCLAEFRSRYEMQARRNMRAAIARVRVAGTHGTV